MSNFLVAFDKCKGSLTSHDLCNLAETVLKGRFPNSTISKVPLTDGGEGFVQILTEAGRGSFHDLQVIDSIGREKLVNFGICDIRNLNSRVIEYLDLPKQGKLAIVEMAVAAGLADLPTEKRNPWETSTYGVGQILKETGKLGVDAVLLGIGGSSTNDAGIGALSALGANFEYDSEESLDIPYPSTWSSIKAVKFDDLVELPPIKVACDVGNTLFGENGATSCYGPQKGLSLDEIIQFEEELKKILTSFTPYFPDALDKSNKKGSGAAGGMGYGLSLAYDVSLVEGFNLVSNWFGVDKQIQEANFVITGEGRFDKSSLYGKGPFEILRLADGCKTPSLIMAGSVEEEAVTTVSRQFQFCDVIAFGRPDWTLDKNLYFAKEQFTETLHKFVFPEIDECV
jgi:glycerate kinase